MKEKRITKRTTRRAVLAVGVALLITFKAGLVTGAEGIDPDAESILKSMSSYLGETKAFSVNVDIDFEVVTRNGQKLQLSSFATAVLKRPAKFHIQRKGMIADAEFIFDGKTLTLHGKKRNVYAQIQVPGTIDDAIRAYELETGIPAPGADLLFADPYAILSSGVVSSSYLGTAYVNGVECHHLAFREDKVDWQLWVKVGDEPLPMKYVITTKWHTAAPQYEIRFRDWNTKPPIKAGQFKFAVPKGARRLETIPVNEMGELTIEEGK
ncbi:MAG: DUF2092 domain-containing protein [Desulfobacteraceae bacterium]|nr:DUF2092 domain-containing protein [Desulfobacteraceae bacterium]